MKKWNVFKISFMAILLAMTIGLGYAESFIPSFWIPGIKPGFANIIILVVLVEFGWFEALIIDLGKVFLVSLLRGSLFQMGFFMSLSGSMLSLLVMVLLYYFAKKLHLFSISAVGAVFHSFGQILVAMIYMETAGVFYYFPFLVLISICTGILMGLASQKIVSTQIIEKLKRKHGLVNE
ncbi:MAG: Gx transporter family protein [Bacilli bacterium]|nr:Gx transporter family protein [Bacilli bacterium]